MKIQRLFCGALAAVLMLTGCSEESEESSTVSYHHDYAGRIIPISDEYTTADYTPNKEEAIIMAKEITAEEAKQTETKLPKIFLNIPENEEISRENYTACTIQIDSSSTDGSFESTAVLDAEIKGRGHSTWEWPKKPYKIKLKKKTPLLGMESAKRWVLLADYADPSFLRNTAAFELARSMGSFKFVPHAIPVDVYINGIYQGIYTLGEQLEVRSSRLDIENSLENVDTGYLLEIGGAESECPQKGYDCFDLPSGCGLNISIESPDIKPDPKRQFNWTQQHFDYIYDYMCKADDAVTKLENYEDYIDVDSFIDWFLVHELTYNLDSCFNRSCFITKPAGGKLKMGPVWDFDLAFGNMYKDNPKYDDWATVGTSDGLSYIKSTWFNYLLTDDNFRKKARTRWDEIKDTAVNAAIDAIDYYQPLIEPSAELNFSVWKTLGKTVGFQPPIMSNKEDYNEHIFYIRSFLNARKRWIDENL